RPGEPRRAQPPHHPRALAHGIGSEDAARARRRVRRLGRTHPPDRGEGDAEDEEGARGARVMRASRNTKRGFGPVFFRYARSARTSAAMSAGEVPAPSMRRSFPAGSNTKTCDEWLTV